MIRFYKIVHAGSLGNWIIGQFSDEKHALAEYNAEVRRAKSEGIDDGRPALKFAERAIEVEYFLTEQEISHTETRRDEAIETGRWGLAPTSEDIQPV